MACPIFGGITNFTVGVDFNLSSVFPNVTVYFYTYTHGIGVVLDLADLEAAFRQKRYLKKPYLQYYPCICLNFSSVITFKFNSKKNVRFDSSNIKFPIIIFINVKYISYLKDKLGGINKSKYILHKEY